MTKAERYVRHHLQGELEEVRSSPIADVSNGLSLYEKTLIYHYTKDGYDTINRELWSRQPSQRSEVIVLLEKALKKLPNHVDEVHRTITLTRKDIKRYQEAARRGTVVREPGFTSTSKSPHVARLRPKFNVKFQILSKKGKSIEDMSFMGHGDLVNEEEVLFLPNTAFTVLGVTKKDSYLLIKLEEK